MEGSIENGQLVGTISNDDNLTGSITKSDKLEPILSPITVRTVRNYNSLINKPQINTVELKDNKSLEDLNVNRLTNIEIDDIINSIV